MTENTNEHLGSSDCSSGFCGVWETLTNEDATYRQRKSFQYVAGGQNGVQKAGSNPARTIEETSGIAKMSRRTPTHHPAAG
jgi:hypothetical protein